MVGFSALDTELPKDRREQDIFEFNDLEFRIPPEQITVQNESLVYEYKTLRTRTSTKIPSGHGNMVVHVTIPFLNSDLLTLHRLIVEVRNSPFCYIENRYLREICTPHDWPSGRSMAFAVASLQLMPMSGTSDAWVVEMDLLWFNYAPYAFNWLYREDWLTHPLRLDGAESEKSQWAQYSIGWQLDRVSGSKIPQPIIIKHYNSAPPLNSGLTEDSGTPRDEHWSLLQARKSDPKSRTIYDMQSAHLGAEFDTLPLPGNMEPSRWVIRPRDSRVYVRYINLLQRDALYRNFGIDVEADLIDAQFGRKDALDPFFRAATDSQTKQLRTWSLASSLIPSSVRSSWINKMLELNGEVNFLFYQYTEVELPEEIRQMFAAQSGAQLQKTAERQALLARRKSNPEGNQPGDSDLALPFTKERRRLNSTYGPRDGKKISPGASSFHKGLDFRASRGSPIYAPVMGVVETVTSVEERGNTAGLKVVMKGTNGEHWYFFHMNHTDVFEGQIISAGTYLGSAGMTGKDSNGVAVSSGPHIHIAYSDPGVAVGVYSDPTDRLRSLVTAGGWWDETNEVEDLPGQGQSLLTSDSALKVAEEDLVSDVQEEYKVPESVARSLLEFYTTMSLNGWLPYMDDLNVSNVWYRPLSFGVKNAGSGLFQKRPELMSEEGAVLTGVSGSISTILARLPILDHEYPTLQYMGATEPSYVMEFAIVDDQYSLDGVSDKGQMISRMRAQLQGNARRFRPVIDGWCLATDSFITRLFGTFKASFGAYADGDLYYEQSKEGDLEYFRAKRRTIISHQSSGTIQGQPGLSTIQIQLQETNPYQAIPALAQSPAGHDLDKDYEIVLRALYDLQLADKYKKSVALILAVDTGSQSLSANADGSSGFSATQAGYTEEGIYLKVTDENRELLRSISSGVVQPPGIGDDLIYVPYTGANDLIEGGLIPTNPSSLIRHSVDLQSEQNRYLPGSNISGIVEDNPELREINVTKLLELHHALRDTVFHSSLLLEEQETGGLANSAVTDASYGLPVKQHMYQGWQTYLMEKARQQGRDGSGGYHQEAYTRGRATQALIKHKGWKTDWSQTLDPEWTKHIQENTNAGNGFMSFSAGGPDVYIPDLLTNTLFLGAAVVPAGRFAAGSWALAQSLKGGAASVAAYTGLTSTATVGSVVTGAKAGAGAGLWLINAKSVFFDSYESQFLDSLVRSYMNSFPLDISLVDESYTTARRLLVNLTVLPESTRANEGEDLSIESPTMWQDLFFHIAPTGLVDGDKLSGVSLITPKNETDHPFFYGFDSGADHLAKEQVKLRRVREALAAIAKEVISDPSLMRALGLDTLVNSDYVIAPGLEAYPDLDLPPHPYFGDTYSVSPDFYMWNIYEDGGAFNKEQRQQIQDQVDAVVQRAYNTFSRLRSKSTDEKTTQERIQSSTQEIGLRPHPALPPAGYAPVYNAEGSDIQIDGTGPGTPFFQANQLVDLDKIKSNATIDDVDRFLSTKPSDYMPTPRMSVTEGHAQTGGALTWGGGQYATRLRSEDYASLREQYESVTEMFGSRAGYLNAYLDEKNASQIVEKSAGTSSEQLQPLEYTHAYDAASLKKLAKDSAHDMVSMKRSIRGAYPTFKFYIVEEDEQEDRYSALDDFYAYNGVKEFTVVQSRKIAADHAIIVLQNIDGTLDGSKRSSIIDVDYFANASAPDYEQPAVSKLEDQGVAGLTATDMARSAPSMADTDREQPFSSVVLRPGMNTQLRVGYSNDPRNLEVLISGRIVDLQWNRSGDLAEILIQSFGTELVQQVKGLSSVNGDRTFYTTHELLGSLMLEPEITHFGRWEFGVLTQVGEGKSAAFDFRDYSREGYLGRIGITQSWNNFVTNNPIAFATGATLLALVGAKLGAGSLASKALTGGLASRIPIFGSRALAHSISTGVGVGLQAKGVSQISAAVSSWKAGDSIALVTSKFGVAGGVTAAEFAFRASATLSLNIATLTLGLDALLFVMDEGFYRGSAWYRAWKHWADTKRVSIFMSPQDDNIFPPHPKDYMFLDATYFDGFRKTTADALEAAATAAGGAALGEGLRALWDLSASPEKMLSKKVDPQSCQYMFDGSTVWEIFHEMTLRHPGWIYGTRPYGDKYEYRMFFGPPNQRYWSKPASNEFIDRMNRLSKYIESDSVSKGEFEELYDKKTSDQLSDETIAHQDQIWLEGESLLIDGPDSLLPPVSYDISSPSLTDSALEAVMKKQRTAVAIKEYLRGLNLRFVPFRRHHLITSDRDIISNGIIGTSNASYNAVDVRYYTDVRLDDINDNATKTTLVKAHTFMPDDQLRIRPMSYSNCRSYLMAVRYGVGQLLHDLREMYRGEIMLLGTPRIRPWDICIMIDTYNDMVGPIEVEQVVHTFSHQTGYVTEIKPSMVVMANEISTWPILEGLKVFALAIRDIENKYKGKGLGVEDTGFFGAAADVADFTFADLTAGRISKNHRYEKHIESQYKKRFGEDGASYEDFGIAYGMNPAASVAGKVVDGVGTVADIARYAAGAAFVAGAVAPFVVLRNVPISRAWYLGAGTALGTTSLAAAYVAHSFMDTPNIVWLLGGANIFLQCLHNETIIAVPLMKNGTPIVSGLVVNDPEAMYKSFAGGINRWIEDTIEGTVDLAKLYSRYGTSAWEVVSKEPEEIYLGDL